MTSQKASTAIITTAMAVIAPMEMSEFGYAEA